MADYILSNNNRYYAALESEYGVAPTITASHRVPGVRLAVATQKVTAKRRDKTGTRTFLGTPGTPRKVTGYEFETSLMAQDMGTLPPAVGQMVQAALGGAAQHTPAQSVAVNGGGIQVDFLAPHGLNEGSAVNVNGQLRFVESVPSPMSVRVCAPFTKTSGATVAFPAVAYAPAKSLPSVSLFDYWDPNATVQRVVRGAGVDEMEIQLDGTEHRIVFRGPAAQHVDSVSFQSATGALTTFPLEPAVEADTSAPVPGHLGQVWLGNSQTQMMTLTKAQIRVKNNIQTRSFEFGSDYPLGLSPGEREVEVQFGRVVGSRADGSCFVGATVPTESVVNDSCIANLLCPNWCDAIWSFRGSTFWRSRESDSSLEKSCWNSAARANRALEWKRYWVLEDITRCEAMAALQPRSSTAARSASAMKFG